MPEVASDWFNNEYLYGEPFFPERPLAWLAPIWSCVCGAASSGGCRWAPADWLRLALGLLLIGPLLGTVWIAAAQAPWRYPRRQGRARAAPSASVEFPYAQVGTASAALTARLARASRRWRSAEPVIGKPLAKFAIAAAFSIAVAGTLGRTCVLITVAGLAVSCLGAALWNQGYAKVVFRIGAPLLLAWLVGNGAFAPLSVAASATAVLFAFAVVGWRSAHQNRARETWQALPLLGIAGILAARGQPMLAAAVALLSTPSVLMVPLLQSKAGRAVYFRAMQLPLLAASSLAALALGYG